MRSPFAKAGMQCVAGNALSRRYNARMFTCHVCAICLIVSRGDSDQERGPKRSYLQCRSAMSDTLPNWDMSHLRLMIRKSQSFFTAFSTCPPHQNCSTARSQSAFSLSLNVYVYTYPFLNPIYVPCPEDASHGILVRDTPPASNRIMCRFACGFPDAPSSWTSSASAARA